MNEPRCGRLTRQNRPCKNPAGLDTDHRGEGACKFHGGASNGAPEDNDNAAKTGEFETLHVSALTDEENALYASVDLDTKLQAENSLRLLLLREHRMLLRLKRLQAQAEKSADGLEIASKTTEQGFGKQGPINVTTEERTSILATIMSIEEALNRIQYRKKEALEQYRSVLAEDAGDHDYLGSIAHAIVRSTDLLVDDLEDED